MDDKISINILAASLAQTTGKTKKFCEDFIREFFKVVAENVSSNEVLRIKGFGAFKIIEVESRSSINVKTGERQELAAYKKVVFTPSKELSSKFNAPFEEFESVEMEDEIPDDIFYNNEVENEISEEDNVSEQRLEIGSEEENSDDEITYEAYTALHPLIPSPDFYETPSQETVKETPPEINQIETPVTPEEPVIETESPKIPATESGILIESEIESFVDSNSEKLEEESTKEPVTESSQEEKIETNKEPLSETISNKEPEPIVEPSPSPVSTTVENPIIAPAYTPPLVKDTIIDSKPEVREVSNSYRKTDQDGYNSESRHRSSNYRREYRPSSHRREIKQEPPKKSRFGIGFLIGALCTLIVCVIIFMLGCFFNWWPLNFGKPKTVEPVEEPVEEYVEYDEPTSTYEETQLPEEKQPEPVYDTVTKTRYLTTIAREHYGDFNFWPYIYLENESILGHPDRITPGTKIVVPELAKYGVSPSNKEDVAAAKKKAQEIYARFK